MRLRDYLPALRYGAKIMPDDLAGMIGLPYVRRVIYIDGSGGSDDNSGRSQDDALATVGAANGLTTSGQQEVALIAPTGGTGRTAETTAISWAKRFTHLVGSAPAIAQDVRAGMSFGTGGSIAFSENGCMLRNLTFNGTTDINVPVTLTGSYNGFHNCDLKGSMNATTGDDTAGRALQISGGQENTFAGCTFGADTFMRSAANATVAFDTAASRNVFEGCNFVMAADNTGPVHILLTGTSAIDRWLRFTDCSWYSFWTNDTDKVAGVMDLSAQTATGHVLLTGSQVMVGFDDWEAADSSRIFMQPASSTANAIGIAINPNVS